MFEDLVPEKIKAGILDVIAGSAGAPSTMEGSFASNLAAGAALEIWKALQGLNAVVPIAFPDESSGGYIDMDADKYGMTRRPGTKARAVMHLTGTAGTVIPSGTAFVTLEGLAFYTQADVTLSSGGTAQTEVVAQYEGVAYNVAAGSISRMYINLSGLKTFTNDEAEGGTDQESDAELFARLDQRRKKPATSGNPYHYEQWAMEVRG